MCQITMVFQQHQAKVRVWLYLVLTIVIPCWLGRQCPPLTGSSRCWMRQLVSSVVLGSSTIAWHSYISLSCTGWTFLNVSSISLEWPSTDVFKAGHPSTWWTAAHLLLMSPAVSVFVVPVATSSSFHDIIAASLVVGRLLSLADDLELSAWKFLSPNT